MPADRYKDKPLHNSVSSGHSEAVPDSAERQGALFDIDEFRPDQVPPPEALPPGTPRLRWANRRQIEFRSCSWNDLLPDDHQARIVWNFVEGLDVSPLLELIQSVAGEAGRSAIDSRILTALWLYATLRGIGSARELDRRCDEKGEVPFQ